MQHLTTDFRPRQARRQAHFVLLFRPRVAEFNDAQVLLQVLGPRRHREALPLLDHLPRDLPANVGNLAFEVADPGLARMSADNGGQGVIRNREVFGL